MKKIEIVVKRDDGSEPTTGDLDIALGMIREGIERNSFGGFGREPGIGWRWTMTDEPESTR